MRSIASSMPRWFPEPIFIARALTVHTATSAVTQELIFVDPDDDLASVRAKLESTAADEIYLFVPRNADILRTPLEFRILARLADELASETYVVSSDPHRRWLAEAEGFPTKRSLGQLRHLLTPESRRSAWDVLLDWLPAPSARTGAFALVLVSAVVAFSYFILPEMRVTITPRADTFTQEFEVTVDASAVRMDGDHMVLPGRKLMQQLEVRGDLATTGTRQVGRSRALGEVLLFNGGNTPLTIPSGTIVMTDAGVRFETQRDVAVPARSSTGVPSGVIAIEPGSGGNVPARTIIRFEDPRVAGIQVANQRPTSGGTDVEGRAVSEEDRQRLRERLLRQARDEAELTLSNVAGDEVVVPSGTVRVEPMEEHFDQELGSPSERLSGRMVVAASAVAFSMHDLRELVASRLDSAVDGQFRIAGGGPSFSEMNVLSYDADALRMRVASGAVVVRTVDRDRIEQELRGKSPDEARALLSAIPGLGTQPNIQIWPEWAERAFRVSVQVASPR